MCGIAGIVCIDSNTRVVQDDLRAMSRQIRHRGPDGEGFYVGETVGLAHTRLSIIDLVSGDQPIHNEDDTVWVVFNGEVFNYVELRAILVEKGHQFYTRSDTEVIVHLYEEYGDDFVDHLNGQFAIALWDEKARKLLLTRDRPGIAPLYFTQAKGRFLFASEVKAMLPAMGEAPRLSPEALDQLMTFWAPLSPYSIFENVMEVAPGEMIILEDGRISRRIYWDFSFPENEEYRQGTEDQLKEELHALLVDATRIRLRSDVPVGAYLSGGLDSSVLTSIIHHHGGVPLRTFSIGFEDKGLDETRFQRQMIDHLQADHSSVNCANTQVGTDFLSTIWHAEIPVLRTAPVPMRRLSGLVREQGYKVVLTGEGSDEVLGGYDIFKEAKIRHFWARHPESNLRPQLLKRLYPYLDLSKGGSGQYLRSFFQEGLSNPDLSYFSHLPRFATTSKCKAFLSSDLLARIPGDTPECINDILPDGFSRWHPLNRAQYLEVKSLMRGYLLSSQGDRMMLANAVEGRFPFLDHNVMEFAGTLHPSLKMKVLNEKYLLKRVAEKYVPQEIVHRHKQPYRAPDIPAFFGDSTPEYVTELLDPERIRSYGYFDPQKVAMLLRKIDKGRAIGYGDSMSFVGILSTQIWHYHFVENFSRNFSDRSV